MDDADMTQLELFVDPDEPMVGTLPIEGLDLYRELRRYQEWMIDQALSRTRGNKAQAARLLGINRTTLVMMLKAQAHDGAFVCRRSA